MIKSRVGLQRIYQERPRTVRQLDRLHGAASEEASRTTAATRKGRMWQGYKRKKARMLRRSGRDCPRRVSKHTKGSGPPRVWQVSRHEVYAGFRGRYSPGNNGKAHGRTRPESAEVSASTIRIYFPDATKWVGTNGSRAGTLRP